MKVLIYRMGGLGDCLLTFPLLEILTKKGHEVFVWGRTDYFNLALKIGFCKKVSYFNPLEKFDLEIYFANKLQDISQNKRILLKPWIKEKYWFVDYYLKELGYDGEEYTKDISTLINKKTNYKREDFCIIHPGSGSKKKNPDFNLFIRIEDFLLKRGIKVKYVLGPYELHLRDKITNYIYFDEIENLVNELIQARFYIGLDSGVSHLSAYLGLKSYLFYGPTDPVIWHPIGINYKILHLNNCKPCFPDVCDEKKCLDPDALFELFCMNF